MKHDASSPDQERLYVWRNLDAYLEGELSPEEMNRIDAFLSRSVEGRDLAEAQREFADAVRRSMNKSSPNCPDDLRDKVIAALDLCEADELGPSSTRHRIRAFPVLGASVLAAAAVIFAVGLVYSMAASPLPEEELSLPARLVPVVAGADLDSPPTDRCRYRSMEQEYRRLFPDGPEMPREFGDKHCRVIDFNSIEIDGRPVMCSIYDAPDGNRFAMFVFKRDCLGRAAPKAMRAAEVVLDDRQILLWEEGRYMRALVGKAGCSSVKQHMRELRDSVER
jgi:hypothetical protein